MHVTVVSVQESWPGAVCRLDLACVGDYNVASTLVQYWAHEPSGNPWKHATLDGQARLCYNS